jgi:hypothetical protein
VTESLPPEDPRDALIREQAGQIEALTALVAELRGRLDAALRAASRNSRNSSMPPSADDLRQRIAAPGAPGCSPGFRFRSARSAARRSFRAGGRRPGTVKRLLISTNDRQPPACC